MRIEVIWVVFTETQFTTKFKNSREWKRVVNLHYKCTFPSRSIDNLGHISMNELQIVKTTVTLRHSVEMQKTSLRYSSLDLTGSTKNKHFKNILKEYQSYYFMRTWKHQTSSNINTESRGRMKQI